MTGFDIAVLLLVGLGAVLGFTRGFVQEILALAAWVVSLFAIRILHAPFSNLLEPLIGTSSGAAVLAFAILLLLPYFIVKLLANSFGEASRNSVLGPIDRVLGFGFGALKGFVITVVAFSIFMLGFDTVWGVGGRPQWVTDARTYPFVNAASNGLVVKLAERRREAITAEAAEARAKAKGK
jgi:membrane protein required for colicin V production